MRFVEVVGEKTKKQRELVVVAVTPILDPVSSFVTYTTSLLLRLSPQLFAAWWR